MALLIPLLVFMGYFYKKYFHKNLNIPCYCIVRALKSTTLSWFSSFDKLKSW